MNRIQTALIAVAFAAASLPVQAQYDPGFPKEEFAARRTAFYEKISDGYAVLLGRLTPASIDVFRQNNNFFYFSGVETPNSILILDGTTKRSTLFVAEVSEHEKRALGPQLEPGEAAQKLTGIDQVASLDQFMLMLGYISQAGRLPLYISERPEELPAPDSAMAQFVQQQRPWDNRLTRTGYLARWYSERFPSATVKSYDAIVDAMRLVKSKAEIEAMRTAGHITALGGNEAIRATRPGRYEYQVAAAADSVYFSNGARRLAFSDIAASGANGNVWHYFANSSELKKGDLILLDTGAEYKYYAADLTRTWPVSGRFTPEQEKMYRCVLAASKAVIAAIKPGVTIQDLQKIEQEVYDKHGFGDIGPPKGYGGAPYVGHLVGLSVHDVGSASEPFVPGVVFNVEPILEKPGIHIRLEDTILVTESGHESFTAEAANEIEDIYRLYDEKSRLYD